MADEADDTERGDRTDRGDRDNLNDRNDRGRDRRDPAPLIKERLQAGAMAKLPRVEAHCTYVLSYGGNELKEFRHTPRFGDRAGSRWCYVVDMSPRLVHGTLKIPARGGRYSFDATYSAHWRVADPAHVVRDNVDEDHGDATVAGFLLGRLRPIGWQFDPDDAVGVEMQINTVLGAAAETGGLPVGNGLALIWLNVELTPDPRVTDRGVALDEDIHQGTLIERRQLRLRHLFNGDGSEILYHLAQNPTDTQVVLQMITDAKDKSEQLRLAWLDRMRDDGAVLEADYESARAAVLGGGSASPPVLNAGSFAAWPNETPIIDADPQTAPPTTGAESPFEPSEPTPVPEPTTQADAPPPPFDPNPFAAPAGSAWLADQESEATTDTRHPAPQPPPDHCPKPTAFPKPTTQTEPPSGTPSAPRDIRADRLASGAVLVRWRDAGDVEYQVRRRLDDGRWQVVAHTKDTFIEDGEAPPGAVCVYAVSATSGGLRSPEAHTGS